MSRRPPSTLRPIRAVVTSSAKLCDVVGGVHSNIGVTIEARSASFCSNARNRRASRCEKRAISRSVSPRSSWRVNRAPSGNRFRLGPAGDTVRPRSASRMSCQIAWRSMLST